MATTILFEISNNGPTFVSTQNEKTLFAQH